MNLKTQSVAKPDSSAPAKTKRVGVMVEFHQPHPHHLYVNQGILRYGQEHGWKCVQAPFACEQIKMDGEKRAEFDYDYCKGCGICALECPGKKGEKAIVMEEEGK